MDIGYTIIPVNIPDNDTDYIKVSGIPFSIFSRDDETGRLIDTMAAELEAMDKAAQVYRWSGKVSFVYGVSGFFDKESQEQKRKTNERIIDRLRSATRKELMNGNY